MQNELLRARTLQGGVTRVCGWPHVILLVLTTTKVIDVKVNKIKKYFISHTKIGVKSPEFKIFKAEKSMPLVLVKNIKTGSVSVKPFRAASIRVDFTH